MAALHATIAHVATAHAEVETTNAVSGVNAASVLAADHALKAATVRPSKPMPAQSAVNCHATPKRARMNAQTTLALRDRMAMDKAGRSAAKSDVTASLRAQRPQSLPPPAKASLQKHRASAVAAMSAAATMHPPAARHRWTPP
jgi:hypothetical protein